MHCPIHGQWWSKRSTQTLHSEQCAARGGRKILQVRHHLSGTRTPLISTERVDWALAMAVASSIVVLRGRIPGSVVAQAAMNTIVRM